MLCLVQSIRRPALDSFANKGVHKVALDPKRRNSLRKSTMLKPNVKAPQPQACASQPVQAATKYHSMQPSLLSVARCAACKFCFGAKTVTHIARCSAHLCSSATCERARTVIFFALHR